MSYEFTKLSDVPVVIGFPVGANTIIETNGEIKRCTSAGGGGGDGGGISVEVPTKTSQLINDSGFLTSHQDISGKQDKLIAGKNITIASDGKTISATGGSEALIVHVTDSNGTLSAGKTYSDILNAIHAGISVFVEYNGNTFPLMGLVGDALIFGFTESINDGSTFMIDTVMILITQDNEVYNSSAALEALPNPNAITFTGAVTGTYDGSAAMTVNIPSAVTDAHINSLIDTKLGVIENGSY